MDELTYTEEKIVDGCLWIRTTYKGEVPNKRGWRICTARQLTKKYTDLKEKYQMLIEIVNADGWE